MKINELNEASNKSDIIDRKEDFTKGTLSKVTLKLKKGPHELLQQYFKIEDAITDLSEQRAGLNEKLKDEIGDLFAAEEKVLTRIIETAEFSATLSKEYMKGGTTVVDYEKIVNELTNSATPALLEILNEIKEKYTKINEAQKVLSTLKVKRAKDKKAEEASPVVEEARKVFTHQWLKEESFISKLVDWAKKFSRNALEDIIPKINAYDLKLDRMKIAANLHHQYGKKQ